MKKPFCVLHITKIYIVHHKQGRQTLDNIGGARSLGSGEGSLKFWRGRGVIFTEPFLLHFYATIFSKNPHTSEKKFFFSKKKSCTFHWVDWPLCILNTHLGRLSSRSNIVRVLWLVLAQRVCWLQERVRWGNLSVPAYYWLTDGTKKINLRNLIIRSVKILQFYYSKLRFLFPDFWSGTCLWCPLVFGAPAD